VCSSDLVREGKDARQLADVRLSMQREVVRGDDDKVEDQEYDVLYSVPVGHWQGGGFIASMPLEPGDPVSVVFAERSLDAWIERSTRGGKAVIPGDTSVMPLEGAIAYPWGPASRSELADVKAIDPTDLVIGKRDGTVLLRLTKAGQAWLVEGEDFIALAAKVDAEFQRVDARIDSELNAMKTALMTAFPAIGAALAANGATAATTFQSASATIPAPTNRQSVAASKSKAT
jgi:hypothetical protein